MNVSNTVELYIQRFPEDGNKIERLIAQMATGESLQGHDNFNGHVTAAAIVLSPDHSKILMIHHNFLGRWLQPGGHWEESEADTIEAAQREAEEETGVKIGRYIAIDSDNPLVPIHIETHPIPERPAKSQPAHYHHDFRYVFEAAGVELQHQAEEVGEAAWFDLDAPETEELHEVIGRAKSLLNM